jgi:hypothetical protein
MSSYLQFYSTVGVANSPTIVLPYGTSPKLATEYGIPFELGPYLSAKYFFKDAGLRMTKSDRAKQKSKIKIKALHIVIFISGDNLLFGLKFIKYFGYYKISLSKQTKFFN